MHVWHSNGDGESSKHLLCSIESEKRKDKKLGNKAIVENSKQIEQKKIVFEIVAKEGNWRKTFI